MMSSVVGENSDLFIKGQRLHIQTEDWGAKDQSLVCRIFKNGAVIKTYRLPYEKIQNVQKIENRRSALIHFHQWVIDSVSKD
jgi:hypothetical protein